MATVEKTQLTLTKPPLLFIFFPSCAVLSLSVCELVTDNTTTLNLCEFKLALIEFLKFRFFALSSC